GREADTGVAWPPQRPLEVARASNSFDQWPHPLRHTSGMTWGVSAGVDTLCRGGTLEGDGACAVLRARSAAVLQVCPMPQCEENERGFHGLPGTNGKGQEE